MSMPNFIHNVSIAGVVFVDDHVVVEMVDEDSKEFFKLRMSMEALAQLFEESAYAVRQLRA